MRPWVELYLAHTNLRAGQADAVHEVRRSLRAIAERTRLFDRNAHARLQPKGSPGKGLTAWQLVETIDLDALSADERALIQLGVAILTVQLLLDDLDDHLHQLTVMVEGVRRADESLWSIAVHLESDRPGDREEYDRKGSGACGHAALHCHPGPTVDGQPKVRVPFPPMPPAAIVEWVISQVVPVPAFDAAPWPAVLAALPQDA